MLLGILRPAAFPLERLQMDYSQKEAGTSYICFGIGILLIICPSEFKKQRKKKATNPQQIKDAQTRQRQLFCMKVF